MTHFADDDRAFFSILHLLSLIPSSSPRSDVIPSVRRDCEFPQTSGVSLVLPIRTRIALPLVVATCSGSLLFGLLHESVAIDDLVFLFFSFYLISASQHPRPVYSIL